MTISAKIAPSDRALMSTPEQAIGPAISLPLGGSVALDLPKEAVGSYSRAGTDLIIHLKSGEILRIESFFADPAVKSHLYFVDDDKLVSADLSAPAGDGTMAATYIPEPIDAGFSAHAGAAASSDAAGGSSSSFLSGGTGWIIGGAVLAGGIGAAVVAGGSHNSSSGAAPSSAAPDTTPPPPATNLTFPDKATKLSGTAEPNTTVSVDVNGDGKPDVTVAVGSDGQFTVVLPVPLTDKQSVTVWVTDAAGNRSIAATAISPDLIAPPAPAVAASNGAVLTGTAEPFSTVTLTLVSNSSADTGRQAAPPIGGHTASATGDPVIATTTADANGHWSITLTVPLTNNTVVLITATDAAGNISLHTTVTIDAVAPTVPSTAPSNGKELTGTAEAGSTVTLTDGAGNVIGTVTADATGHWSFTPASPLPHGTIVNFTATDAAGNVSQQGAVTIDAVPPAPPVITSNSGTTITGTGDPGDTVTLTDSSGHVIGTAVVDSTGHWSFSPNPPLAAGTPLSLTETDAAGNISTPSNTTDPPVGGGGTPTAPAAPIVTTYTGTMLSGTGQAGDTVTLTDASGNTLGQVTVAGDGHWSFTPGSSLANGLAVTATETNSAGLSSPAVTITIDAVPPGTPVLSGSNGLSVSGTAEAGTVVTLTDGSGNLITHVTAATDGSWSYTPPSPLANGTVIHATATDAAGNVSSQAAITVDNLTPSTPTVAANNGHETFTGTGDVGDVITLSVGNTVLGSAVVGSNGAWSVTPSGPLGDGTVVTVTAGNGGHTVSITITIDFVAPNPPSIATSNGTALSGTAEAGSIVTLTDGNGTLGTVTVIADSNNHWSYTPATRLANGDQVHATATDAAGNVSSQSTITVDASPPATPVVHVSLHGAVLSGTGDAGSTVTVTDGTGNMIGTTTVSGGGTWTLTPTVPLDDGTVVRAAATDSAGNVSQQGSAVVDATAPAAPIIAASNGTTLSGTAEANSTVTVTYNNGSPVQLTATTDATGHWSITPGAPIGNNVTVTATATDASGNVSTAGSTVIDGQAPSAPTVSASNGSHVVGTAEAGSTITLTDGSFHTTTTADANGNWSVDLSATPLANGSQVSVTVTDAVGNISSAGVIIVDSTLASIPIIAPSNGATLHGTGDAGDTITLTDANGTVIGSTTVQGNGTWTFTPGSPLADGAIVHADASNGNGPSAAVTISIDAAAPLAPTVAPSQGVTIGGTAEAGSIVTLTDINGTIIGSPVTVGANGQWSVGNLNGGFGLADGTVVHVTATDAAGNVSTASTLITDSAPPATPVSTASDGTIVSGTAEAGSAVTLTDNSGTVLATTIAGANGYWSIALATPQANGTVLHAFATDAAGNQSASSSITVDAVAPGVPVIAASNGQMLTGTAEAGSSVTITFTDANGNVLGHTLTGVDGHWSFTPPTPLANGTVVDATATDSAGNTSLVATTTIDMSAPSAPTIALSNGQVISGTAEAGSTITITDSGNHAIGTATADGTGHWSFLPASALGNGTQLLVTATDAAGNVSAAGTSIVDAIAPNAPAIAMRTATAVGGTAEAGSIVTLTDDSGTVLGQTTTSMTGNWSFTAPGGPLPDGTVIHVTATDAAGNISPQTIAIVDAVAPAAPVIAASSGTSITGTAEAGSLVTLTSGGITIATVTADGTGHWTYSPAAVLANGTQVTATATDGAGNISTQALTLSIDSVAPGTPVITPNNGIAITGAAEAGSSITLTDGNGTVIGTTLTSAGGSWSFTPSSPLANGTVVHATAADAAGNVSGQATINVDSIAPAAPVMAASNGAVLTGTAEAGATIILLDASGNTIGQTTVLSNGTWSFTPSTPFANGAAVRAVAVDPSGNTSTENAVTVDAMAPNAPVVAASNGTQLHGTGEAGATITLTDSGNHVIGSTTVAADGTWSFTPASPLANNTGVGITATDVAGNVSGQSSVTIDRVAPAISIDAQSNGVAVNGTGEAGAIITLTDSHGTAIGAAIVAANGTWAFTPVSPLANNTVVEATATDASGNVSAQVAVTIDSVAPNAPVVGLSNGTSLHGTGEAGSTITLTDGNGGGVIGQTTVAANGTWAFTPASQLANGMLVNATATDAAGNVSQVGATVVDAVAPGAPVMTLSNGTVISGTAEAGSIITLTDSHGNPIGTATAAANGTWSFTPGTQLLNNTLVEATATDAAGNVSSQASVTVDSAPPPIPTIDPTNGQVLSGTAEAGSTVTLTNGSGNLIGSAVTDSSGHWSLSLGAQLPNGGTAHAMATDATGNSSSQASITVNSSLPTTPTPDASNGTVFSGTADIGATVTLTDANGNIIATVTAASNGGWSYIPSTPFANGTVIHATAQDSVSGPVSAAATVVVDATPPAAPVVNASNGTGLTGTGEAGSTINLVDGNGNVIGSATATATGTWSFSPSTPLANGTVVRATVTDAAHNVSQTSTITVDSVAPSAPIVAPTNGVAIIGTEPSSEAGGIITLTDASGNVVGTTIILADGTWSFAPLVPLANGTVVHAEATDAAGNVSLQATVVVDTMAPAAPIPAASNGIVIQGSAEPGSVITLADGSGNPIGTTIAAGNGHWTFTPTTPLANGTIVHATATDASGNVSPQGATIVDAVAPVAPILLATNGAVVGGIGEAGATVTILNGSGVSIGTAVVAADGHWSVTVTPAQANGATVFAYETDAAGNVSAQTSIPVDAVAPPAPVIAASDGLTIHGTEPLSEAGDTVTVTDAGGTVIGTATVAANGTWSVTPSAPLANGTMVHAYATDAAGNASTSATTVVDRVAPAAPIVSVSNGSVVTGTAEAGALVTVTDGNGTLIGRTTAAGNGTWSFTPGTALANGTILHATATDAADNVSLRGTNIVDSLAPANPTIAASNGTELHGTAEALATVTLFDATHGTAIGTVTAAANGTWSLSGLALANNIVVQAHATDSAGNQSGAISTVIDSQAPAVPTIAASNGIELHGTAEAGALLTLTDGSGHAIGSVIVAGNGSWSYTPATPLAGSTVVHATATDAVGNVSPQASTTIDTTPPPAVTASVLSNGTSMQGTSEANATITIVVNGDTAHPIVATTDGSGHFSVSLSPALVDGQTLTVTATDQAGNSGPSATVYAPELTPPVVTVPEAADGYVNAAEISDGIQTSVGIISGMHVGDVLSVTLNGTGGYMQTVTHAITAADIAAGKAAITLSATGAQEGAASVTATLNGGASSTAVNFTIDTIPPTNPVLSLVNNILTVSGTPGVALVVDAVIAGVHFSERVTANSSGLASLNLLTGLNANLSWDQLLAAQVSVYAVDAANNSSNIVSVGVASHIVEPPTVGSFALSVALIPATLGFSGTAGPGETLSVAVITPAATVHLAPIVDSSGHFAVNLLSPSVLSQLGLSVTQILNLGAGLSFEVTATDAQGHVGPTYDLTLLGSGATLHLGTITVGGTAGDDILPATTGSVETFVAGAGNDLIQHVTAGDIVNAGAGNDTIQVKAAGFTSIAGGTGFDTLLMENGITLNFGTGTPNVTGIERFNLGTNGTLTLTASAINTITDGGNILQITGDSTDTLKISGAVGTGTTQTINGLVYDVYHQGAATLLVQEHTVHVVVT